MKRIRLATRGSPLALAQAKMAEEWIRGRLGDEAEFEIVEVKTLGDKRRDLSLEKNGGNGLFTKEVEVAVLDGRADIAVHSAKDLPVADSVGLVVAACLPRDASRDVLITRQDVSVPALIATGSPRRRAQLKSLFPQAVWTEFRGNVETRLKKIALGSADATALSEAGLKRLGIDGFEGLKFTPIKLDICVPAAGQGIIALQCREEDAAFCRNFTDVETGEALALEREFLRALGGGCQTPCGANFDGILFRFFHEHAGLQKISLPRESSLEDKLKTVREIALAIE